MSGYPYLRYTNGGAIRNKPLSDRLAKSLGYLPDLGLGFEVFSGGQDGKGQGSRRTGSVRHDHGGAGDGFFYDLETGKRLSWQNAEDLPRLERAVAMGKANGITGWGAGEGYMQPGSFHLGFGNEAVWGAGGKGANAPDWLRKAYNGAGAAPRQDLPLSGGFDPHMNPVGMPPEVPAMADQQGLVPAPMLNPADNMGKPESSIWDKLAELGQSQQMQQMMQQQPQQATQQRQPQQPSPETFQRRDSGYRQSLLDLLMQAGAYR